MWNQRWTDTKMNGILSSCSLPIRIIIPLSRGFDTQQEIWSTTIDFYCGSTFVATILARGLIVLRRQVLRADKKSCTPLQVPISKSWNDFSEMKLPAWMRKCKSWTPVFWMEQMVTRSVGRISSSLLYSHRWSILQWAFGHFRIVLLGNLEIWWHLKSNNSRNWIFDLLQIWNATPW